MKLTIALSLLASASAFMTQTAPAFTTRLHTARVDASDAIQQALEASRKYGAASPEAKVAWDAVEEISAADNSAAFQGSLDQECGVEGGQASAQECIDYTEQMKQVQELLHETKPKLEHMKELLAELKNIRLISPDSKPAVNTPAIQEALAKAKQAVNEYGATSNEAKLAYEELEEVSSAGLDNAMGARLDEECLVDTAMEACMALDELNRVMSLDRTKTSGYNA